MSSAADASSHGDFRDLRIQSAVLQALLVLYAVISGISVWIYSGQAELLTRIRADAIPSDTEIETSDFLVNLIDTVSLVVIVAIAIIFLKWIYDSARNARILGNGLNTITPGWSIGWYFVPLLCIWKPYQAMREAFRASHPAFIEDWQQAPRPLILPFWWFAWLFSNLGDGRMLIQTFTAETPDELLELSARQIADQFLEIPASLTAMVVVRRLWEWQSEKGRSRLQVRA